MDPWEEGEIALVGGFVLGKYFTTLGLHKPNFAFAFAAIIEHRVELDRDRHRPPNFEMGM